ncbi:MAG: ATP-binding protein [Holophagales bacterium]|nr:ATP-binding protein [Holophagales bacterium]
MREISLEQRLQRMRADNPWWMDGRIRRDYEDLRERGYCQRFADLVTRADVKRAAILMGPRRVGKTVLLYHVIKRLLEAGRYSPREIAYLSLDQPLYTGLSIEAAAAALRRASGQENGPRVLFLDEIQYLADWERHLKAFVDSHPAIRCIACGSAAAALKRKSAESGAGRFTDFLLPPLTFWEFLRLQNASDLVEPLPGGQSRSNDIQLLNEQFLDYVNFGGFPEAITSSAVRADPGRYIGTDIVEKVLLRDLPSLYGIRDVQELNRLFTTLAYNTAEEVSLEGLSQNSGVTKLTLRRYLEYLEAAFLIKRIHRIDENARRFKRTTHFKVYVTSPSLRTALFGPVNDDHPAMGAMVETAVFAQWFHSNARLNYARWSGRRGGEVDIVHLDPQQRPDWCLDVKWSDRPASKPQELTSLIAFSNRHPNARVLVTSKTKDREHCDWPGAGSLNIGPAAHYCHAVGRQAIESPATGATPWFVK